MKTKFELKLWVVCVLFAASTAFTSCKRDKHTEGANSEQSDSSSDSEKEAGLNNTDAAAPGEEVNGSVENGSASGTLSFDEGTLGYSITEWVSTDETSQAFTLDALNWEGEEVSAEGRSQLDMVAQILEANPNLNIEIQGHSNKKNTKAGDVAAKAASKARAEWAKLKLIIGHDAIGSRISTKGYGSEMPLEGIDPTDDAQKRIVVLFSKG
jgi:outer membrane protein OmpA-like peptidoglycan-associated protein